MAVVVHAAVGAAIKSDGRGGAVLVDEALVCSVVQIRNNLKGGTIRIVQLGYASVVAVGDARFVCVLPRMAGGANLQVVRGRRFATVKRRDFVKAVQIGRGPGRVGARANLVAVIPASAGAIQCTRSVKRALADPRASGVARGFRVQHMSNQLLFADTRRSRSIAIRAGVAFVARARKAMQ